ncbi:MAG: NAD(P)/FAD-dependent oxidoreductase [Candidatus Zixiibacteriota bacterium]
MRKLELAILGAGPAGITAGIYAKRAGIDFAIIEKEPISGLITNTMDLENYPGFPEPQTGNELMEKFKKQLENLGTTIEMATVEKIEKDGDGYKVKLDNDEIHARTIIISTGSRIRPLGIPDEEKYIGRGISYCATCDGPLYSGKKIAIVGTGNSGIQEGLFLLKFVGHIDYIEMLPNMIAEQILQDRIAKHDNVDFHLSNKITKIEGDPFVEKVTIENVETGDEKTLEVDGIFVFIGYLPNTKCFEGTVELDKKGYIIADHDTLGTSAPGIFAAGDVRHKRLRQVATAVGDGANAVFSVQHYLENLD